MIVLDTHIWIWWVGEVDRLSAEDRSYIQMVQSEGLGVSAFSVWEVAKLHQKKRIEFSVPLREWITKALERPFVELVPLSPDIIVDSIDLPGNFHDDPADQVIVATARVYDCPLLTYDEAILKYPNVKLVNT